MQRFIVVRALQSLLALWVMSLIVFGLARTAARSGGSVEGSVRCLDEARMGGGATAPAEGVEQVECLRPCG